MTAIMERPVSAASSHTSHKRGISVTTNPLSADNNILPIPVTLQRLSTPALFVNNLRLLDFDLLPDWPGITTATFGNQDARARIRGTEFALYQLFRFYDPMITSEKLQPFFPPLEPLQSINLRAALYRCLNDLKKNGVLGRETVLRKSMLDECQGDKFWELCLAFSATVVRKVTLSRAAKHGRPVAEQIGLAQHIYSSQLDSMLPLAVAHRGALKRVLREKKQRHDTHVQLYNALIQKEAELQQRKAHAQEHARKRPYTAGLQNIDNVAQTLAQSFEDSDILHRLVVNGDDVSSSDSLLIHPFEELWTHNSQGLASNRGSTEHLLEDLQQRATQQTQRLRKWQTKYEKMQISNINSAKPQSKQNAHNQNVPKFDQHRSITVRDAPEVTSHLPKIEHNPTAARYDEILTAMRDELRRTRQRDGSGPVPVTIQRAQTTPATPLRKISATSSDMPPTTSDRDVRSSSYTAVPVRPSMFGRRLPSRSRSYQQPKVDSQRQPIPLKSELFSPLKTQPHSISPVSSSPTMLPSPLKNNNNSSEDVSEATSDGRPLSLSSEVIGTVDSGIGVSIDGDRSEDCDDNSIISDVKFHRPMAGEHRRGLSTTSVNSSKAAAKASPSRLDPMHLAAGSPASDSDDMEALGTRPSLAERTRQSILQAPAFSQPGLEPHLQTPHLPKHRPINYDETPIRARKVRTTSISNDASVPTNRNFTPHEELFSSDAVYESVFKARPKVALSPVLSAQKRPDSGRISLDYQDVMLASGEASRSDYEEC